MVMERVQCTHLQVPKVAADVAADARAVGAAVAAAVGEDPDTQHVQQKHPKGVRMLQLLVVVLVLVALLVAHSCMVLVVHHWTMEGQLGEGPSVQHHPCKVGMKDEKMDRSAPLTGGRKGEPQHVDAAAVADTQVEVALGKHCMVLESTQLEVVMDRTRCLR